MPVAKMDHRSCAFVLVYEVFKVVAQYKLMQRGRPQIGFFKTLAEGARVKRERIGIKRLWFVRLCINRRATRRKNKQSNVNETDFSPSIVHEKKGKCG